MVFFFKQKTAYEMRISDWSSDVCSSDLKGKYLSVKGPLNMTRPPQGYPVLFSAGQSEYGRDLTAKVSDCNFVHMNTKEEGVGLMADIKGDRKSTRLNSSH